MAHIYALVVTDEDERGFDALTSTSLPEALESQGLHLEWLTNPLVSEYSDDDFDAIVLQHGDVLDSLDADNQARGDTQNLRVLVQGVSRVLAHVHRRVEHDTWPPIPEAAQTLERCLDAWDEFEEALRPCDCGTLTPGILWPWNVGDDWIPEGWSCVERCDSCAIYEDDEVAARALIEKHGIPATEVEWISRHTGEVGTMGTPHSSVAINIPEGGVTRNAGTN